MLALDIEIAFDLNATQTNLRGGKTCARQFDARIKASIESLLCERRQACSVAVLLVQGRQAL